MLDERQARIVEVRFFGGLTIEETAAVLQISPATIKNEWSLARGWLYRELHGAEDWGIRRARTRRWPPETGR